MTLTIPHGTGTTHTRKSEKVLNALDSNYWLSMCLIWLSNKFTCTKPVSKVTKSLIYIIYIIYIHTHNTYILYIQFVTTWSNIVFKWCTTDWNKSCNCHQAARSFWEFWARLLTFILPTLHSPCFNVLVAFAFKTTLLNLGVFLSQDHLIGLWRQERARRGSRKSSATVPHTCLDLWCSLSCWPHSVLESSYSKLCPSYPPWSFCRAQKWKKPL